MLARRFPFAQDAYITPQEARKLAEALVELADSADGLRCPNVTLRTCRSREAGQLVRAWHRLTCKATV